MRRIQLGVVAVMVVSTGVLALAGPAAAKVRHHHRGGTGGPSAPITIQVDPSPLVETSSSAIAVVIQVETASSFAGDTVTITSSQLDATCSDFTGYIFNTEGVLSSGVFTPPTPLVIPLTLDNEGNAAIDLFGQNCAPGSDLIDASMTVAPYYTAVTTLVANPPAVTIPGVLGFPTSSGAVTGGEVETGDGGPPGSPESNVYAVFYVETDPVYAEQYVTVDWTQLADRCLTSNGYVTLPSNGLSDSQTTPGAGSETSATAQLDDDGNAVFIFAGSSCAAGSSLVTADVEAGTHPTYTTTFNILPPQPTI
jgi:hypothetical protein